MAAARKRAARRTSTRIPESSKATLDALPFPELVFALIMPAGADLPGHVSAALRKELESYGYSVEEIRLSGLIQGVLNQNYEGKPEQERIRGLMRDGTRLRETVKRGDAVAMLSVAEIRRRRAEVHLGRKERNAYILNSIKHPSELQTLRHIYGWGFFSLSIYAPRAQRIDQLAEKIAGTSSASLKDPRSVAEELLATDEQEEGTRFGQNVREVFPESDFFVDARSKPDVDREIKRFLELVFSNAFRTPSRDEYGMYHAKAGAMRSSDLGRQVGAVIATESGDVIAVGCNDVPKAFGGLYWEGDPGDSRDFQKGIDSNAVFQGRILTEIFSRLQSGGWLASSLKAKTAQELVDLAERDRVLEKIQLAHLLEFGRAVHAEMAALMDAARRGAAVKDGTLYSTTFPCHLCTKHIVAAGIKRVVYIEPYPKSKARDLYSDSIAVDETYADSEHVIFTPFVGVAPRQYLRLFQAVEDRKDRRGKPARWKKQPKMTRFMNSYLDVESSIVLNDLGAMLKKLGTKSARGR